MKEAPLIAILLFILAVAGAAQDVQQERFPREKPTPAEIERISRLIRNNLANPSWYDASLTEAAQAAQRATSPRPAAVWTLESGELPPGITLTIDGRLTGSPDRAGTFAFRIRATVPDQGNVYRDFEVVVDPNTVIDPTPPPRGRIGQAYTFQFKTVAQFEASSDNDNPL